jgi:hypothetical protein
LRGPAAPADDLAQEAIAGYVQDTIIKSGRIKPLMAKKVLVRLMAKTEAE